MNWVRFVAKFQILFFMFFVSEVCEAWAETNQVKNCAPTHLSTTFSRWSPICLGIILPIDSRKPLSSCRIPTTLPSHICNHIICISQICLDNKILDSEATRVEPQEEASVAANSPLNAFSRTFLITSSSSESPFVISYVNCRSPSHMYVGFFGKLLGSLFSSSSFVVIIHLT